LVDAERLSCERVPANDNAGVAYAVVRELDGTHVGGLRDLQSETEQQRLILERNAVHQGALPIHHMHHAHVDRRRWPARSIQRWKYDVCLQDVAIEFDVVRADVGNNDILRRNRASHIVGRRRWAALKRCCLIRNQSNLTSGRESIPECEDALVNVITRLARRATCLAHSEGRCALSQIGGRQQRLPARVYAGHGPTHQAFVSRLRGTLIPDLTHDSASNQTRRCEIGSELVARVGKQEERASK
jgi:hypothetical protein